MHDHDRGWTISLLIQETKYVTFEV